MTRYTKICQTYFLRFLLYALLGWLYEVFLEVVVYRWGYSDRGVLFGPWCPVYGVGAMAFLLCFRRLLIRREPSWLRWGKPLLLFLGCMAVATAIELAASYLLPLRPGGVPDGLHSHAFLLLKKAPRVLSDPGSQFVTA